MNTKRHGTSRTRIALVLLLVALAGLTSGCSSTPSVTYAEDVDTADVLHVYVGGEGYRDVLEFVTDRRLAGDLKLDLIDATDDANSTLDSGAADLAFFQTQPAFLGNSEANSLRSLSVVSKVNVAPYALYSSKWKGLAETDDWVNAEVVADRITGTNLPHGSVVALPNTPAGFARGLYLLQSAGLVRLDREFGGVTAQDLSITQANILESQRHLAIQEMDTANYGADIYRNFDTVVLDPRTAASIGLVPERDSLAIEPGPGNPYARVLVAPSRLAGDARVSALARALEGPEVAEYLNSKYQGANISAQIPLER